MRACMGGHVRDLAACLGVCVLWCVCVFSVWKTGDSLKKGVFWSEELIFSYFYLLLSLGPFPPCRGIWGCECCVCVSRA